MEEVTTPQIKNDFFAEMQRGPAVAELDLYSAIFIGIGHRFSMMSKRLSPPMTFHNARIYTEENILVWKGDLKLDLVAGVLDRISDVFKIRLFILRESGDDPVYDTDRPGTYLGEIVVDNKTVVNPRIYDAMPYFEEISRFQRRRWMIDHGMARRNIKEFFSDLRYALEWKFYYLQRGLFRRQR